MIKLAVKLHNAIEAYIQHIRTKWEEEVRKTKKPLKKERPSIIDNELTTKDWTILLEYLNILAPLKEARIRLEGRAAQGDCLNYSNKQYVTNIFYLGKNGALWEVLYT